MASARSSVRLQPRIDIRSDGVNVESIDHVTPERHRGGAVQEVPVASDGANQIVFVVVLLYHAGRKYKAVVNSECPASAPLDHHSCWPGSTRSANCRLRQCHSPADVEHLEAYPGPLRRAVCWLQFV